MLNDYISKEMDIRSLRVKLFDNDKFASLSFGNGNFYQAKYHIWGTDGILSSERAYSIPPDFTAIVELNYNTEKNWTGRKKGETKFQINDQTGNNAEDN